MSQFAERKVSSQSNSTLPHMMIVARAGTGKTTTLVQGVRNLKGMETTIEPSDQQRLIWEALSKSPRNSTCCFVAFNKSIQLKLAEDTYGLPNVEAKTMHALGFNAVRRSFNLNREAVEGNRVRMILENILGKNWRDIEPGIVGGVNQLVGLCKMSLCDPTEENLDSLCGTYDIDIEGYTSKIYQLVPEVLDHSRNYVNNHGVIDHNDMIWLPIVHNLPLPKFDLLLVDEAQDLNRCQQEMALRMGRRIIFCGDPAQAIYGFAGADSQSMFSLNKVLNERSGCERYELNVTRRCGKAIVNEARQYVKDFHYLDSNPDGEVLYDKYLATDNSKVDDSYVSKVKPGDMIICRVNAPLVGQFFKLLKRKIKATIIGRKIGENLINLIKRFKAESMNELEVELQAWYDKETLKEQSKKFPSEPKLLALADKRDCIECFMQGSNSIDEMIHRINEVFSDTTQGGVTLASIHKAKGLEADTVWLITPKDIPFPHPMARTPAAKQQEFNLRYVAITRAKKKLVYLV